MNTDSRCRPSLQFFIAKEHENKNVMHEAALELWFSLFILPE